MSTQETFPCDYQLPDGALPGQFCKYHIATEENPGGTDCAVQADSGRVFKCPFITPDEAINGKVLENRSRGRICADFAIRNFGPDSDFKIS